MTVRQVVSYGISINLVEVTWKSKIKAQFPNPNDYSQFMGNFSTATGAVTFLMMLLSRVIFRKFGWGTAALITPTVLLITGAARVRLLPNGLPVDYDCYPGSERDGSATPRFAARFVLGLNYGRASSLLQIPCCGGSREDPLLSTVHLHRQACCSSGWCCSAAPWTRCWRPSG